LSFQMATPMMCLVITFLATNFDEALNEIF
jgi:hypothetical protein